MLSCFIRTTQNIRYLRNEASTVTGIRKSTLHKFVVAQGDTGLEMSDQIKNIDIKVAIIADNASTQFGGEAILPFHYYTRLKARGLTTFLVTNERCKEDLDKKIGTDTNIIFVDDSVINKIFWRLCHLIPSRIFDATLAQVTRLITQKRQKNILKKLIENDQINIIHQPTPVSPREPSLLYNMRVPVIIGPMNGSINFPDGFNSRESFFTKKAIQAGRSISKFSNLIMPGKRKASVLLAANSRTLNALKEHKNTSCKLMVENGVDLNLWKPKNYDTSFIDNERCNFVFSGRLVGWKAVDILLKCFKKALIENSDITLTIIGSGPEEPSLRQLAKELDIYSENIFTCSKVHFTGWQEQSIIVKIFTQCDVFVLPSLMECGGAVVLEAMASALPVIASNWGGPQDYINQDTGILVPVDNESTFTNNIYKAMCELAKDPDKRKLLGTNGRTVVEKHYDWNKKIDMITDIYLEVIEQS